MIAEIIVNSNARALNRIFDYIVPKEMEKDIFVGARIYAPFGKGSKLEDGFVIGLKEKSEFANKEIAKIIHDMSIPEEKMNLAKLMSRKYFCNISDCIKLMLPPGTAGKQEADWTKEKTGNFVCLAKEPEEIEEAINVGDIKTDKHKKVLEFLIQNDGMYLPDLESIMQISSSVCKTLEKKRYIEIVQKQIERNPFLNKNVEKDEPKQLNAEQKKAYNSIARAIEDKENMRALIYGITGSGKTEVYLQLIAKALELGKSAIMLVPEISLTPQMVDRFLARFGDKIAVLHSKLSAGERYDEWKRIEEGKAPIVIGARSAIFAPVKNLGIIIIDEEHDMSYKSDMSPRYHAKELAKYITEKSSCPLVLGSATPDISTYKQGLDNDIALFTLSKRANNASLPKVEIVDLRQELAVR